MSALFRCAPVGVAARRGAAPAAAAAPDRRRATAARRSDRTACDHSSPANAWRCTSRASASCDVALQRGVERVGLACRRASNTRVEVGERRRRRPSPARSRRRTTGAPRRATARSGRAPRLGAARACGLSAARSPRTTKSLKPSLNGPAASVPNRRRRLVSFSQNSQCARRRRASMRSRRHAGVLGAAPHPSGISAQLRARGIAGDQDQVLRAQSCGSRCSVARARARGCAR